MGAVALVRARNPSAASENRIHDDEVARRYGFRGGLVPGVMVYAYLTRLPASRWGRAWLERGTMRVRFRQPAYEDDELVLAALNRPDGVMELSASSADDVECAAGEAAAPPRLEAPDPAGYPDRPPGRDPVEPDPAALDGLRLRRLEFTFDAARAGEYLDLVDERLPLYRAEGVAHPGWLLGWANRVFAANVRLGPWIHAGSDVAHLAAVTDGARLSIGGRVAALFERGGHRFADLDLLIVANGTVPAVHIRHTVIYRIRPPAGEG